MRPSRRYRRISVAFATALIGVGVARSARATCNVIPSVDHTFPSELGSVSTPFAGPGQEVVVRRDTYVFASDPARNIAAVTFEPPSGPGTTVTDVVTLAPGDDSPLCAAADCLGESCRCARLLFPDTDAEVGSVDDRHTLTGPVTISVVTDGVPSATINRLFVQGVSARDAVFPHFVALPPLNDFAQLVEHPGTSLLSAADDQGNLFVPLDMRKIRPASAPPYHVAPLVQFVEAQVPGLGADLQLDVFATNGRRLPPLVRETGTDNVLGTADGPDSVIRVDKGALRAGLVAVGGAGPLLVPGVTGFVDPLKRADATSMIVGDRYVVYENPECTPLIEPRDCRDLDGDGQVTSHFLYAFDQTIPRAEPIRIDAVDQRSIAGDPAVHSPDLGVAGYPASFPPFSLYNFSMSDDMVGFTIPETTFFDLDRDGQRGELLRKGAFDLRARAPVPLADGAVRLEVSGALAAFSLPDGPSAGDVLYVYDAAHPELGAIRVHDDAHPRFFVTRFRTGNRLFGFDEYGQDILAPHDFAVRNRRVAFVVDEAVQGEDLTGDGDQQDGALMLLDTRSGVVTNLRRDVPSRRLELSDRWLVFETTILRAEGNLAEIGGSPTMVDFTLAVVDLERPTDRPHFICQGFGVVSLTASLSDSIVPCVGAAPNAADPDADPLPRFLNPGFSPYFLRVWLPDAPGGAVELDTGLAVKSPYDVQVLGRTLIAGVAEGDRARDLDGNCRVDPIEPFPFGAFVVQTFNARTLKVTNTRENVLASRYPFLRLHGDMLTIVGPGYPLNDAGRIGTTLFDLDGDGAFELPVRTCPNLCGVPQLECELRNFQKPDVCGATPLGPRLSRAVGRRAARAWAILHRPAERHVLRRVKQKLSGIARSIRRAARNQAIGPSCETALMQLVERCRALTVALRPQRPGR